MITLNILLTVKNESDIPHVRDLLIQQATLSRQEPGCLRFEVYQSQNSRSLFILNEHWDTPASIDAHRKAAAYTTIYAPQVLPLVDRVAHPSDLVI